VAVVIEGSAWECAECADDPLPLETDEARKLAARWAYWQALAKLPPGAVAGSWAWRPEHKDLTDAERARLFAWVRARMAGYVEGCLGCLEPWHWSKDVESDRDEMAGWVAEDLGLDGRDDPVQSVTSSRHGEPQAPAAMALCEAAGWPP
jgi:hypothetical protein